MSSTKAKVKPGRVVRRSKDLLANWEPNPARAKVRISIMLDGDLLLACKKRAAAEGTKYQTLINQVLREVVLGGGASSVLVEKLVGQIRDMSEEIQKMHQRVRELERSHAEPRRQEGAA